MEIAHDVTLGVLALAAVVVSLAVVGALRRADLAIETLTHGLGALGAVEESLKATNQHFARLIGTLTEIQAPNALVTRVSELETAMAGAKMTVADAVEKVTALANRRSAREARAERRASLLEDGDEDEEISPAEQQAALRALGVGVQPTTSPGTAGGDGIKRTQGSGWDRVRRKRASGAGGE